MHFDSVIAPAFSIASTPGSYALIVGAGVSKSSGVPSAWDVQVDLVQRAALLAGEDLAEADVEAWWAEWSGESATYSGVLEKVAPGKHERQALLCEMFEPDEDERARKLKEPTPAHRAIAELVRSGHIRVIVTTNFDLLLERAIRDSGIEPYVVADASAARGLPPIHTLPALVVHLHGDYLNPTTMLNTSVELEAYEPEMGGLLREILNTHGLIVVGWSATWDAALRASIESESRKFYLPLWIEPFELSPLALRLSTLIGAQILKTDADTALPALSEAVAAIVGRQARHPLLPGTEVEAAKRALSGRPHLLDIHDLLRVEFERLRSIPESDLAEGPRDQSSRPVEEIEGLMGEAALVPAALIATTAYWGDVKTDDLWFDELERFSRQARGGGITRLLRLRVIAGERLFYAAGVAAVAASRWDLLIRLLTTRVSRDNGLKDTRLAQLLRSRQSVTVFEELRATFEADLLLGAERYEETWERFEFLSMLVQVLGNTALQELAKADHRVGSDGAELRLPEADRADALLNISRSIDARGRHMRAQDHMPSWLSLTGRQFQLEVNSEQERHPLVLAGLGDWRQLLLAAQAIEFAIGTAAEAVSWELGSGWQPSFVWIDGSTSAL